MLQFFKMSGSGNDFIIIDNRSGQVEDALGDTRVEDFVKMVCTRRISLGADGLILIEGSKNAHFSWRFFNSDGSEVEMCGNGGRCAARFAYLKGIAPAAMSFETKAGIIDAFVEHDVVKIRLTDPRDLKTDYVLPLDGKELVVNSVNTGVPHVVCFVRDLDHYDVCGIGRKIRYHEHYHPGGTNANFVNVIDSGTIEIRTYERGVEDETLACGTGAVASVLISSCKGFVESPVAVHVRSGEILKVYFERVHPSIFQRVYLEGKTRVICEGTLWKEAYSSGS
ncbi:MAG: diaminopimelate epimerase [Syntrophales bacterium]|nr:diaminopimelate epimerase [Syntrophales bacterium]